MNLLIVDDEIYTVQGLLDGVRWEQLHFHHVLTANSYSQAVNIFLQNEVNILLCDIEMPYGSGIELVEWVKAHYPQTECIFLTCHGEFNFAQQAIKLRCLDYLLKPVKPDVLEEVLGNAVKYIISKEKSIEYQEYGKLHLQSLLGAEESAAMHKGKSLEMVESYIRAHINEPLTVEELAKHVHLNPDYLSRSFKKKYNMTPIDYITEQRMFLAKELLLEGAMSVSMISAKVGYANYSYFTKMFKKYYGLSPREFQQEQANNKKNT